MRMKINSRGGMTRLNEAGRLHSFNGKPAYIAADGMMAWYDDGVPFRFMHPDGTVIRYNRVRKKVRHV